MHPNLNMLSDLFKTVRQMQAIKQSEIAEYLGISQSSIAKFETGIAALNIERLKKVASYLSINPDFLENEHANPFKSEEPIKMFLPTRFTVKIDFSLIYFIVESNYKVDLLFLSPNAFFIGKLTKDTVFEYPIYAIVLRDQDDNMFIFRRKEKSYLNAAITGEKHLEVELNKLAKEYDKIIRISTVEIDKKTYNKIQAWDDLTRDDLIPLFNNDIINKLCREKNITFDKIVEYSKSFDELCSQYNISIDDIKVIVKEHFQKRHKN
jgi:transcriptional regulator with XRE-family HTH domain